MVKFVAKYFVGLMALLILAPSISLASPVTYQNVLNGVNRERTKAGISVLSQDPTLDKVAEAKLADMKKYKYFSHTNPATGYYFSDWFPNLEKSGYKYIGENLARRFKTSENLIASWMNSSKHKQAMLRDKYSRTGIAVAVADGMVVQIFGN